MISFESLAGQEGHVELMQADEPCYVGPQAKCIYMILGQQAKNVNQLGRQAKYNDLFRPVGQMY